MPKKREHRQTSKAADESMDIHRTPTQNKIIEGMKKLKVGGTFEQIAESCDLKPSQVWKRLSELKDLKLIYDCNYTRKLSSGRNGIVWQVMGLGYKNEDGTPVKPKPKPTILPVGTPAKIKKQTELF